MDLSYSVVGFLVGLLVGLTGVGGGAIMTPILIYGYGVSPAIAVGTDLLVAAITKLGASVTHARRGNIEWRTVAWLAAGSLPAAALVILFFGRLADTGKSYDSVITSLLGATLVLSALSLLFKQRLFSAGHAPNRTSSRSAVATVLTGLVIGALVAATSVGAGALGAAALLFLCPLLGTARIVGTDLAHASLLAAVAGLGHAHLGTVDYGLLAQLLLGSLPGTYLGTLLGARLPERLMQRLLGCTLLTVGLRSIF